MAKKKDHIERKRKVISFILICLIIMTLAFIWGNSLDNQIESSHKSMKVLEWITPVLEWFVGADKVTEHLVRKLGHFTEFSLLGAEMAGLLIARGRLRLQGFVNCLFVGLSVAVIDETIQIFSQRGSQVQDVLLDFAGAFFGLLLIIVIHQIVRAFRKHKRHS